MNPPRFNPYRHSGLALLPFMVVLVCYLVWEWVKG
jgi:hypothetical protein